MTENLQTNPPSGFYNALVKASGARVVVRIERDVAQIVERVDDHWEYDPNWYPLTAFEIRDRYWARG